MILACPRAGARRHLLPWAVVLAAAAAPAPAGGTDGAPGRVPWTSSRIRGRPEPPPPYRVEPAFPHLSFRQPLDLAAAPGTERLFVAEQEGKVYSIPPDPDCSRADLFFDLTPNAPGGVIYGMTFHPDFQRNRFFYLTYVLKEEGPQGTRVSRFEVSREDPPRVDPASEKVIITWRSGGHNGGCLAFGPDGCLYLATGDAAPPSPPDPLDTGQDIGDLLSSILRIDVSRREDGREYAIPPDNPFRNEPGARPEVWAYGLRNPWKMSFDRLTGDLWLGDVGWELWEMVYRGERGGNYGWSVMEGLQPVRPEGRRGPTPILPPVWAHPHSEAASVTGGFVYRGRALPGLAGAYVYGDYVSGRIWGLRWEGGRVTRHEELAQTPLQIVAFGEDHAGELCLVQHGAPGQIYRLVERARESGQTAFPRQLSETGLYSSTREAIPAPGVIAYSVNAEPWSDGARAERLLALPGASRIDASTPHSWKFPEGTVLAKTIYLECAPEGRGVGEGRRRLETQILHFEGGTWRTYSYRWREDQSDAVLSEGPGFEARVRLSDSHAPGGVRERSWRFAGRAECALCHNAWTGPVLGANGPELNRDRDHRGVPSNQLRDLERMGVFERTLPEPPEAASRLADPCDAAADLGARARSYLHVNCAHCHTNGAGGTATIELSFPLEIAKTNAVGTRPVQGSFGIDGGLIIAPGDPSRSLLYYRMAKMGSGHMPRIGSRAPDPGGLAVIREWIRGLGKSEVGGRKSEVEETVGAVARLRSGAGTNEERAAAIRELVSSTRGALVLSMLFEGEELCEEVRKEVLSLTRDHPRAEVRDLFERFLPEEERTRRLGAAFRPEEILTLGGDAARGREIFAAGSAAPCKSCHAVQGEGGTLGPDLSHVGKKYGKGELLQELIDPSRQVAPEYAAYLLLTRDGQTFAGLLVERNEKEVVLKDARSELLRVEASRVRSLERRRESLMPDLLLQDLTPQGAADLIEYLASLK